jgi:hypothetical protein
MLQKPKAGGDVIWDAAVPPGAMRASTPGTSKRKGKFYRDKFSPSRSVTGYLDQLHEKNNACFPQRVPFFFVDGSLFKRNPEQKTRKKD